MESLNDRQMSLLISLQELLTIP